MEQQIDLSTIVSGRVNVTVEEIGTFVVLLFKTPLQTYAGNAYVCLTRKSLFDDGDFFEFVSFDLDKKKLVVKVNKK